MTNNKRKLRILALHGWKQNADRFRMKTGAFRKLVKRHVDFEFLDAPWEEPALNERELEDGIKRLTWFLPNEDRTVYHKWHDSVLYLRDYMVQNGPFDGVLGFSQGTTMTLILAALQSPNAAEGFGELHKKWSEGEIPPPLKFIIMVGGFVPRDGEMTAALERLGSIPLPSLHIMGQQDEAITTDASRQLMSLFESTTTKEVLHDGGHVVPHGGEVKQAVTEFLEAFQG